MKKKNMKKTLAVIFAAALMGTAGCGSKSSIEKSPSSTTEASAAYENNVQMYGAEPETYEAEEYAAETYDAPMKNSLSARSGSDASYTQANANPEEQGGTATLPQISEDKLVYHCNMTFETKNYDESVACIRAMIQTHSGFLESEEIYSTGGYGDQPPLYVYSATIRVPSSNYQAFVNASGSIGSLKNQNQNVTNLTQEYNDLAAELEVLETKRNSYLSMMEEAKKLEDMDTLLMVDDRITQVEIQINQLKTRMNRIDNDAAYSYIDITVSEVREITEYEEPAPDTFGRRISRAFHNAVHGFTSRCKAFVVWCVRHVIVLGVCLVLLLLFWLMVIHPFRKKRKEMKKEKASAEEPSSEESSSPQE